MGFPGATLPRPALVDLLQAEGMYLPPAKWKFAKSFRLGDSAVPVTCDQQPVLISGCPGGAFQAGRVPL
jgi:hypothetical protein